MRGFLWGASIAVLSAVSAHAQTTEPGNPNSTTPEYTSVDEIIVTAQRREQSLQSVPIAVTALSSEDLKESGLDGPRDLVLATPNVTFQRKQFRTNFQIRGIGSQLNAVGGDDGVGIHFNNAPLITNFVAEAEFFDVERVEVLRGPQGTLYGRNATGGVVNLISAKPKDTFSAEATGELGNYDSQRFQGYINAPLGDQFSLRLAGMALERGGYSTNTLTGTNIDNRSIRTGRATLRYHPNSNFDAYLLWEGFREDDTRGARKTLCAKDDGLATIGGVASGIAQGRFSGGCLPVSVYSDQSYGTMNTLATLAGRFGANLGIQTRDSFAGKMTSRNLREVEVFGKPDFEATSDLYQLGFEWRPTETLTISSLTNYSKTDRYSQYDATGGAPTVLFSPSPLAPTAMLSDALFGATDGLRIENAQSTQSEQLTQELRLQSSFSGPVNFSVGANYIKYDGTDQTLIASNILTRATPIVSPTAYIDTGNIPDFTGHNYFTNYTPYQITSQALFGEVNWQMNDDILVTGGLRYTEDTKKLDGSAPLFAPGRGPILAGENEVTFEEMTGRLNLAWSPDLAFTDRTLIYGGFSRGYKAGGFNNPAVVAMGLSGTYEPEFVNAFEIGTKNTLAGGAVILNGAAFYYDYQGYQVLRQVNRAGFNENIDAVVKGAELEAIWNPTPALRLNANIGYLDTEITSGRLVDTFARTQGASAYVLMNSTTGGCLYNTAGIAALLAKPYGQTVVNSLNCGGPSEIEARLRTVGLPDAEITSLRNALFNYGSDVSLYSSGQGEGVVQDLTGNELPNAPKWTASLGAEYRFDLPGAWGVTLRADYYVQADSFARNNNAAFDRIQSWSNTNISASLYNDDKGLTLRAFVKNVFDEETIVGFDILDEGLGSVRQPVILDPRLFGFSLTKSFN